MTDAEYVRELKRLAGERRIERVIVDPSAASFLQALRREGFRVIRANNDVSDGIRVTADLLKRRQIVICDTCRDCLREMETYCWDTGDSGMRPEGAGPRHGRYALLRHGCRGGDRRRLCGHLGGAAAVRDIGRSRQEVCELKWFRRRSGPAAVPVQLRDAGRHPFGMLEGYTPLRSGEIRLYRAVREAVPVVDAAIYKLIRMAGGITAVCGDRTAERELREFLRTVPVGRGQYGLSAFLDGYLDSLLTCGQAVGEIVPARGNRDIAAILCGRVEDIEIREGDNPLDFTICGPDTQDIWGRCPIRSCCCSRRSIRRRRTPTVCRCLRGCRF